MFLALTLMSGCGLQGIYATETERTLCRELRSALPTWSVNDTQQSRDEGSLFIAVFNGLCAG